MDKGSKHRTFSLIAGDQSAEAAQPTDGTLNYEHFETSFRITRISMIPLPCEEVDD